MIQTKRCVICGNEFKASSARVNAKCCSNACRYILQGQMRAGANNPRWMGAERERTCQKCGKSFRCYSRSRKFCSIACATAGQKRYYGKEHPRSNPLSRARGAQSNSKVQQKWAAAVIKRDQATCRHCGAQGFCKHCGRGTVQLHAHHILPWKKYPEHRASVANGITLCSKCHRAVHSKAAKENRVNSVKRQTGQYRAKPRM